MVNKKQMLAGGIIAVILVTLVLYSQASLSLVSSDYDVELISGKVYHVLTLTVNSADGGTYVLHPKDYQKSDGTVLRAGEDVTFKITPSQQICTYTLQRHGGPIYAGQNLNLWNYYTLGNPSLQANLKVESSSSSNPVYVDGAKFGDRATLNDKDGNGIATIETQGMLQEASACPDISGNVVLNNYGSVKVVSASQFNTYATNRWNDGLVLCAALCSNPFTILSSTTCAACLENTITDVSTGAGLATATNFANEFDGLVFNDPYSAEVKTSLSGTTVDRRFGVPVVLISADQDYVESFIYTPPAVGEPKIVSLSNDDVKGATSTTRLAIFENTGDSATFQYTISADRGSISPSSGTLDIASNSQVTKVFSYNAPSVSSNTQEAVTIKLCAGNQFGGKCVTKVYTFTLVPSGSTKSCPDGTCSPEIGENHNSCPQDCPEQLSCNDIPNSHLVLGQCICNEGYATKYDPSTGKQQCTKDDWEELALYGILGISVLVLIVALYSIIRKPKPHRRRRR